MSMVSRIALSNMKYHKSKNILTGIAIFLTTLLLFLVPTIGMDLINSQKAAVNELYPTWHALFRIRFATGSSFRWIPPMQTIRIK